MHVRAQESTGSASSSSSHTSSSSSSASYKSKSIRFFSLPPYSQALCHGLTLSTGGCDSSIAIRVKDVELWNHPLTPCALYIVCEIRASFTLSSRPGFVEARYPQTAHVHCYNHGIATVPIAVQDVPCHVVNATGKGKLWRAQSDRKW